MANQLALGRFYHLLLTASAQYNMASLSQHPPRLFRWTVCAYRKSGMSEEDFHQYISEKHAPLVRGLLAKYGMIKYTMVSINLRCISQTRCSTTGLTDPFRRTTQARRES